MAQLKLQQIWWAKYRHNTRNLGQSPTWVRPAP